MRDRFLRVVVAAFLLGALSFATMGPAAAAGMTAPKYVHALCKDLLTWQAKVAALTQDTKAPANAAELQAHLLSTFGSTNELTDALLDQLAALGTPAGAG